MSRSTIRRIWAGAICAAFLAAGLAATAPAPARAAFDDPLFVLRPLRPKLKEEPPKPPPVGDFEGPCGIAVSNGEVGNFLVSDYYHDAIDRFGPAGGYADQIEKFEPLDGPCGLSFDGSDVLYVNNFHRNVVRFTSFPAESSSGVVITGAGVDSAHPTGVAADPATGDVYVNDRTELSRFDSSGAPLGTIGAAPIGDAYGLAISRYPGTSGRLYVPDAADNTVKVFDPTISTTSPVATIDGHETPVGHFVSLRDSAVAVDNVTGEIYVADDLQPEYTERPETAIYVFTAAGAYKGRLKYNVVNALPPGLAVDNSTKVLTKEEEEDEVELTQGRVYVTTENSERAAVLVYPPGAATSAALPAPPLPAEGSEEELGGEFEEASFAAQVGAAAAIVAPAAAEGAQSAAPASAARKRRDHRRRNRGRHAALGNRTQKTKRGRG
jgi:DNA-binding beta-propeller fold protein YncE